MESKEDKKLAEVGDGNVLLRRQVEGRIITLGLLAVEKHRFFPWPRRQAATCPPSL